MSYHSALTHSERGPSGRKTSGWKTSGPAGSPSRRGRADGEGDHGRVSKDEAIHCVLLGDGGGISLVSTGGQDSPSCPPKLMYIYIYHTSYLEHARHDVDTVEPLGQASTACELLPVSGASQSEDDDDMAALWACARDTDGTGATLDAACRARRESRIGCWSASRPSRLVGCLAAVHWPIEGVDSSQPCFLASIVSRPQHMLPPVAACGTSMLPLKSSCSRPYSPAPRARKRYPRLGRPSRHGIEKLANASFASSHYSKSAFLHPPNGSVATRHLHHVQRIDWRPPHVHGHHGWRWLVLLLVQLLVQLLV